MRTHEIAASPHRWWVALLLVTGMLACYAHRGSLSVAAPAMMTDIGFSKAEMGILLSAFFWSYSLMQVPSGWLVDRFGLGWSYAAGFALWSVATAATGLATGIVSLIVLRMLVGVGQGIAFPASSRAVANFFPERERGTVTASYLAGNRLGQALVASAGAFVLHSYGWPTFFFIIGLIPLVWVMPWVGLMRHWETPGEDTHRVEHRLSLFESFALLRKPEFAGNFFGFFAYDYIWFLFLTWLPGYLALDRKFSAQELALFSSFPFLVMSGVVLASGFASDWLVRRGHNEVRTRKLFICAGLSLACLIVPAGMVEDNLLSVGMLSVSMWGIGIAAPNTWTLTQAVCPKRLTGTAAGIQNFGGNLGGVIAPALTGWIAHTTGSFLPAFWVAGGIVIAGMICYWLIVPAYALEDTRVQVAVGP